ncbi:MAG: nucleotidyltransferase family protein [Actinomycetota bacterium]
MSGPVAGYCDPVERVRRDDVRALIEANRTAIRDAALRHKGRSVAIFGSVARGEATADSDIDFLVDFGDSSGFCGYLWRSSGRLTCRFTSSRASVRRARSGRGVAGAGLRPARLPAHSACRGSRVKGGRRPLRSKAKPP